MNAPLALPQIQALIRSQQFAEAEAALRPQLGNGGPLELWRMLVNVLRQQKRLREARDIQVMLVDARPGDLSVRFDLSEILLQLGEFERGWREYHYRYSLPHTTRIERKIQMPRWDGRAIPGQTLLIHDEQGYGDTLQFMRLLALAKERSHAEIILQIDKDMLPFAARMHSGVTQIIARDILPPAFNLHCEMMSLPMAMGLKLEQLPGKVPYTHADPARLEHWKKRLADMPRPRVALNWAGRPTHPNDANRSMAFSHLTALADTGVTFLSIQKGTAATDAQGMKLVNLSEEITSFEDTAAILSLVDLLISIDSSPVHMAGALGRPAWVLLPYISEWRWLEDRVDTPWYPTLRLFRQQQRGDWSGLMQQVKSELVQWRKSESV
jgi:hypothetical protein